MDPCDLSQLRILLARHDFHISKAKGQNFLIDASVPDRIAASACHGECVVEIGPGVGSLTQRLCRMSPKVVAIEKDTTLNPLLKQTMYGYDNLTVLYADALKMDFSRLVEDKFPGQRCILCANLPYYITTPMLTVLLEAGCFASITVMVQKEVAQRICADAGTAEYGAFSIFCQFYAQAKILFDVLPSSFFPQPKVTSAVVQLVPVEKPVCAVEDEALFFRVVRASFNQRRKTLVNALRAEFSNVPKDALERIVTSCGFAADIRGERLDLDGFSRISNVLMQVL